MSVSDWSAVADENTTIDGIDIAEHCPAKNINNALRAVMADLAADIDAAYEALETEYKANGGTL